MTAPLEHPSWCDRQHADDWPAHSAQVGADLELTNGLRYAVLLFRQGNKPTEVHLIRHTDEETSLTLLSLVEASILRDLLTEGLGLVATEVGR